MDDGAPGLSGRILDSLSSGVMAFRAIRNDRGCIEDFLILSMNPAAEVLTRRRAQDTVGSTLMQEFPGYDPAGLAERYREVVETGVSTQFRIEYTRDGIDATFDVRAVKLDDGLVVSFSDVSAEVQALQRAEEAVRARNAFLATMSHEIRTPMSGVLGMVEMLSDRVHDPEQAEMVSVIRESGELMMRILDDILDLRQIETGKLQLETRLFDIEDLVNRVRELYHAKAEQAGTDLQVVVGPGSKWRTGDPHRLHQVLNNLVGNAVKFTKAGTVLIEVDCADDGKCGFRVSDTGIGMSEAEVSSLFSAFTQANRTTARRFGGTGLGLSIVKGIVTAMKGDIRVESAPGAGTRFSFTVPLPTSAPESAAPDPADQQPAQPVLPQGLRVLAADDNALNRRVLGAALGSLGLEVRITDGGMSALEAFREHEHDLVLLDISMPGMDGLETLAAMRAHAAETRRAMPPAIAITANAMRPQISSYLAAGFDAHLAKPVRRATIRSAIWRVLHNARIRGTHGTDIALVSRR